MREIIAKGQQRLRRQLDLTNIDEDFGILSGMVYLSNVMPKQYWYT